MAIAALSLAAIACEATFAMMANATAMANELRLRSISLEVHDLRATVDQLTADGYGLVGGIGQ